LPNRPQSDPRAAILKWLALVFAATLSVSCARQPQSGASAQPTPQAAASPIPWGTIQPPAQTSVAPGATPQPRLPVRTFRGRGVVRLINLEEGWFEIDHEDIEGLMPAMQMEWSVRDKSLLKSVSVGDRVEFTLEDDNGNEVVTELKKAP
jgi:Cu/Ag efflux protein CusF